MGTAEVACLTSSNQSKLPKDVLKRFNFSRETGNRFTEFQGKEPYTISFMLAGCRATDHAGGIVCGKIAKDLKTLSDTIPDLQHVIISIAPNMPPEGIHTFLTQAGVDSGQVTILSPLKDGKFPTLEDGSLIAAIQSALELRNNSATVPLSHSAEIILCEPGGSACKKLTPKPGCTR